MRRAKRRSSRALVGFLIITITAGSVAAYKKFKSSRAAAVPLVAVDKTPARASNPINITPAVFREGSKPLLMQTQTPGLATQGAEVVIAQPRASGPKVDAPRPEPIKIETPRNEPVVSIPLSNNPLVDGQAKFDAGDLLGARALLNEGLSSGQIAGADADTAKELIGKISDTVVFGRKLYKDDPRCAAYTMQMGDRLQKLAVSNDITWELLCRVNGISDPRKVRANQTIKLIKGPFNAVVTKSRFTMDIYLGMPGEPGAIFVRSFQVGLGKDDSTPAGKWIIERNKKLKNPTYYSPRGEGIIASGDPRNPLGSYWLGLAGVEGQATGKQSYGIHGTIDPNSIGKQESMGCIRMHNEDVAIVFELLVDGKSTVVVKD